MKAGAPTNDSGVLFQVWEPEAAVGALCLPD